jgi:hypothetical protein
LIFLYPLVALGIKYRPVRSWFRPVPAIARGARCDDVEFVAIMRHLWAGGRPRREADLDVVVAKHLGGAAVLGRLQRASGSERDQGRRAVHDRYPSAAATALIITYTMACRRRTKFAGVGSSSHALGARRDIGVAPPPTEARERARYGGRHAESKPLERERTAGRARPASARRKRRGGAQP